MCPFPLYSLHTPAAALGAITAPVLHSTPALVCPVLSVAGQILCTGEVVQKLSLQNSRSQCLRAGADALQE